MQVPLRNEFKDNFLATKQTFIAEQDTFIRTSV